MENTVSWAKPSGKGKSFWDGECSLATKEAKAKASRYRVSRSEYAEHAWRAALKKRDKVISKAKTLHFRRGVHEIAQSSRGVWGIVSWARNDSTYPKPLSKFSLMRRTEESLVTTFEEKVNTLRKTFFPPPPQADISDILEAVYSSSLSMSS